MYDKKRSLNDNWKLLNIPKGGRIGRGWYEDEPEENKILDDHSQTEICELATDLLKDKLTEVFNLIKERKHERNA